MTTSASNSVNWEDSGILVPEKRKRFRKYYDRRVKPFPRVLKRDIRRTYAAMLMNVMNSYDAELILKFFTHFCHSACNLYDDSSEAMSIQPNAQMALSLPSSSSSSSSTSLRHVQGPEHIALHMLRGMDLVPDCTVRLRQASIHQFLNTKGSKIVCHVTMSGTKLFKYAFHPGSLMLQNINVMHEAGTQEQVFQVSFVPVEMSVFF